MCMICIDLRVELGNMVGAGTLNRAGIFWGSSRFKAYHQMISDADPYIYLELRREMQNDHKCELIWLVMISKEADSYMQQCTREFSVKMWLCSCIYVFRILMYC